MKRNKIIDSCQIETGDVKLTSLTCSDVTLPYVHTKLTSKLYLDFDDGTANDKSPEGNNGVINGATNDGFEMSFDGIDDYIDFSEPKLLTGGNISVSFWINPQSDEGVIMMQGFQYIGAEWGWLVLLGSNNHEDNNPLSISWSSSDATSNFNSGIVLQTAANTIKLNEQQHVAITKQGSFVTIYINRVVSASGDIAVEEIKWPFGASKVFTIGRTTGHPTMYQNYYHGSLNEVLIFDKALSATEVNNLMKDEGFDGQHVITVSATDSAGNTGSDSVTFSR